MAETPEAGVKRQIRAILATHEVYQRAPTTGGYGRSGQLDFTVCVRGYFLAIEAKSIHSKYGHKGPTALQWKEIDEVYASGGIALSIDETNFTLLHDVLCCLRNHSLPNAHKLARASLTRHTRPAPTEDPNPPTKRKSREHHF